MKFKYRVLQIEYDIDQVVNSENQIYGDESGFNKLGAEGWQLIAIDRGVAYFIKAEEEFKKYERDR